MPLNTLAWNRVRYTLLAPLYDAVAGFRPQRRRSLELLDARPGERVLVDGCGTGADLAFLPAEVHVVATDITPAMVARTARRARALGRRVDARVMDAQALEFADGSFDAVVLHLILAVVPDPVAAIREAARVLKPGGRAVVFDKWVPDCREPSLLRRAGNLVSRVVATEITRKLGPLVAATPLQVEHREPAGTGGFFSITLLRKPASHET
ncbi:MAG: putative phosphatidylethanolamine N-methyltransferase [uncultured Gemmatimonadetes bacterium]|uniref:Putative phosphatidylethanolamine N-methyltransferase n=1 Tax=uncultured Gemmatimonadota bacterium TaxID=203437 RepID=A0A6J4M3Z7_9BACT|nr:MAG: putative phosphatidylethanolamine N-methyltransferase [uncultured Gemmatimonadota bacterium]